MFLKRLKKNIEENPQELIRENSKSIKQKDNEEKESKGFLSPTKKKPGDGEGFNFISNLKGAVKFSGKT